MRKLCLSLCLLLSMNFVASAQTPSVSGITQTPVLDSGHNYIQSLNEIVDPSSGSLSIRIAAPSPHERGMNLPHYAFSYDTNGAPQYTISPDWTQVPGVGGLGFAAPALSSITVGDYGNQQVLGPYVGAPNSISYDNLSQSSEATRGVGNALNCGYVSDFVYTDPNGGNHNLNVQWYAPASGTNNIGCPTFGVNKILQGGDPYYRAALSDGGNFFPASIQVTDSHGNVVYPGPEDPNGNGAVGTGRNYLIQNGGPNLPMLTSTSIPGLGAPYTIAYEVVPLNYQFTFKLTQETQPASCQSGRDLTVSSGGTTVTVPQSVTLPNGQQYTFGYDPTFGFINHITYPTGATVDYTWSYIPQSQPVSYGIDYGPQGGGGAGCAYRHDWMGITKRVVKMGGTPVSEQDFVYQTNWGTNYPWASKTTEVFMKDFTRAGTPVVETIYTYLPEPVSHRIRPLGVSSPETIALESTIQYYGTSGPAIRTVTKTWYPGSAQQLLGECVTDAGGTSGKFYQYQLDLKTDVAEFDYGQNVTSTCQRPSSPAPRRETVTVFHVFAATPIFPAGPSIMDRPDSVKVYGDGTLLGETDYTYDESSVAPASALNHDEANYGPGSTAPRGNATTIKSQCFTTGCTPTVTHYGYDETGQLLSTTDAKGNPPTTYSYVDAYISSDGSPSGSTNTYVSKITRPSTNGVAHVQSFTYGFTDGKMRSSTDENGNTTTYCYLSSGCSGNPDPWARETEVVYPDTGNTTVSYSDSGPNPYWITSTAINTGKMKTTKTVTDALGHVIQTQLTSDPSGTDFVDTTYDGMGRTASVSNPYRSTSDPTYGITSYTYDALGRKVLQSNPDKSVQQMCYDGIASNGQTNCTTNRSSNTASSWIDFSDETGRHWQRASDALERLIAVMEPNASNTPSVETDYKYDALNDLTRVDQWGGPAGSPGDRFRTFFYDSFGQLTSSMNIETGAVSYSYDANGNMQGKRDARGVSIGYTYDVLNRVTAKGYSDNTPSVNYKYDVATAGWTNNPQGNLIGRLTGMFDVVGVIYGYDAMGRMTLASSCTPSVCGASHLDYIAKYDLAGDMTSLAYPDGRLVTSSYDGATHLTGVQYASWNGQSVGYNYLAAATYMASGSPQILTYGNGTTSTYISNQRMQLTDVKVQGTFNGLNPTVYDKHYCYGVADALSCPQQFADNGNISYVLDVLQSGRSQGFSYDNLDRLVAFSSGDNSMSQSFGYDPWGNMTQAGTQTFQTTYTVNNQIAAGGFSYDAAGNLTQANFGLPQTFAFNAEGQISNVNSGADTYTYDGAGQRVRKDVPGNWTEYALFNGQALAEKNSDGSWSDYIYGNGQRIARADSYDERIHITGTSTKSGSYAAWYLPFSNYVIRAGDKISWRQYQTGAQGGIGISFTDHSNTNWSTRDTDGQAMNSDGTESAWHIRTVDLSSFAGKTAVNLWVTADSGTPVGTWNSWFSDIAIYSADGSVISIYNRQTSTGLTYWTGGGETTTGAIVERSNTASDSELPGNTTSYYVADQIGSARMLMAAEGWPVSSDTYYPYGVEQYASGDTNHYKFTGKERDSESGLDYFGARYYSSNVGRFISPDWSAKVEPVPYAKLDNPQSLNLYSYVYDNPLSGADKDGHGCPPGINLSATTTTCKQKTAGELEAQEKAKPKNPPPVPVPGGTPGTQWKWNPDEQNSRGGTWGPDKWNGKTQGSPPNASWDDNPGKGGIDHWDVKDGNGNTGRVDANGEPLTTDQAHGWTPIPFSNATMGSILGNAFSVYTNVTNGIQNFNLPNLPPNGNPASAGGVIPPPPLIFVMP